MAHSKRTGNAEHIHPRDFSWSFWFTLPLYPFDKRRTIRTEVLKDTIWTFDQFVQHVKF